MKNSISQTDKKNHEEKDWSCEDFGNYDILLHVSKNVRKWTRS